LTEERRMSLGDLTWFKAIATTVVFALYAVVCCLVISPFFSREAEREEVQREPRRERAAVSSGDTT